MSSVTARDLDRALVMTGQVTGWQYGPARDIALMRAAEEYVDLHRKAPRLVRAAHFARQAWRALIGGRS